MIEAFKTYLIKQGYSEVTPSGKPSTVYDYAKRVLRIYERENTTIKELAVNIGQYVDKYGKYGVEYEFGKRGDNVFFSALKRFKKL